MRPLVALSMLVLLTSCSVHDVGSNVNGAKHWDLMQSAAASDLYSSRSSQANKDWTDGVSLYQSGNEAQAVSLFKRAAQSGHLHAATQVGWCYEFGRGVPQDYSQAAYWYRFAAENGEPRAMKNLGQFYENGTGVTENWMAAAVWYRKSADNGNGEGAEALACAYQFGIGVPQSRALAIEWNERGLADGREDCEHYIRYLSNPTNYVGFRNLQEEQMVIGDRLRTSSELLGGDPQGVRFRSSAERLQWLRGVRSRVDADEAQQHREDEIWRQQYHENEVRRLEREGMDHSEAERMAP